MFNYKQLFSIQSDDDFNTLALQLFKHQFEHNSVYRSFCDLVNKHPSAVSCIKDIPFLPIQFFKTHKVLSSDQNTEAIFESSGTSQSETSKHYVFDLEVYEASFRNGFDYFYGDIEDYAILALLPSYLERSNSSLVYMVNDYIKHSQHTDSGFYLDNLYELKQTLLRLEKEGQKTLLIGVSFALLDFIERYPIKLKHTIIMETGGMKGRRRELIKSELHEHLKKGFSVDTIHSEYGMTELLSQAYSFGNGLFKTVPWMKVLIRNINDPFDILNYGKSGGINCIDLANIHSCAFIATQDLGRFKSDSSFELLGRFDTADIRGCNLMVV